MHCLASKATRLQQESTDARKKVDEQRKKLALLGQFAEASRLWSRTLQGYCRLSQIRDLRVKPKASAHGREMKIGLFVDREKKLDPHLASLKKKLATLKV